MKINITKYEYEKVRKDNVEYTLPDETTYWFQTGIRRSIKMIPVWTTWNKENYNKPEEIWKYIFIMVYSSFEAKIERVEVTVSEIESLLLHSKNVYDNPMLGYLHSSFNKRTEEQFISDFKAVLDKLNT